MTSLQQPHARWHQAGHRSLRQAVTTVLVVVMLGSACAPRIRSSLIHPDADKNITFTASRGDVQGGIAQMEIKVAQQSVVTCPGENCTFDGGPYPTFSNQQLWFEAVAHKSGGSAATAKGWVYVANAKGHWTFPQPTGGDNGYPSQTSEQTGANLYRLDQNIVRTAAQDAVLEYVDWHNAQTVSTSDDITVAEALNTADHLVAAVAYYVDEHMSWRADSVNRIVFANNGFGAYAPGWDFPQPADLTLTISGDVTNGTPSDDYEGDCEDHAILRAALLRALGFAPWGIWDVIDRRADGSLTHEYNIVLYEGAFRIMDYGRIGRWLATHTWDAHRSYYGWNEDHGPRGANATTHGFLVNNLDNYPGGKDDGNNWSYLVYYQDTSP